MQQNNNGNEEISVEYTEPKAAKSILIIEGIQAIRCARHFSIQGEHLDEIMKFYERVKQLAALPITSLKITRTKLKNNEGFYIELTVFINQEQHVVGYKCREHIPSFYPK